MEILSELAERRARRSIREDSLPADVLGRLARASCLPASCFNSQPWRLVFVTRSGSPENHAAVGAALTPGNAWALKAPAYCILCTKASLDCRLDEGRDYAAFDLGQAALALQLQAWKEGLYAHPMAGFAVKKLKAALGIPEDFIALCTVAIGYPDLPEALPEAMREKEKDSRSRKALGETVFAESFGSPFLTTE